MPQNKENIIRCPFCEGVLEPMQFDMSQLECEICKGRIKTLAEKTESLKPPMVICPWFEKCTKAICEHKIPHEKEYVCDNVCNDMACPSPGNSNCILVPQRDEAGKPNNLKLFLVMSNLERKHDLYEGMIVCAESEEQARHIHPETKHRNTTMDFFDTGDEDVVCSVSGDGNFYYRERYGKGDETEEGKYTFYNWNKNIRDLDVIEFGAPTEDFKAGDIIMTSFRHG